MPGGERPPPCCIPWPACHNVTLSICEASAPSSQGICALPSLEALPDGSFDLELNMLSLFPSKEGTTSPGQFNGSPESQDGRIMRKLRHVNFT